MPDPVPAGDVRGLRNLIQHTAGNSEKFNARCAESRLERFVFEESCRLEQTAALLAHAHEFLKERRVLFPAESVLLRLVGE